MKFELDIVTAAFVHHVTSHGTAPPAMTTVNPVPVIAPLTLKIQRGVRWPLAFSVSTPVRAAALSKQYTPGESVTPDRVPLRLWVGSVEHGTAPMALNVSRKSAYAAIAAASPECCSPLITPPVCVTMPPGRPAPTSPVTFDVVTVTAGPPNSVKLEAAPNRDGLTAAELLSDDPPTEDGEVGPRDSRLQAPTNSASKGSTMAKRAVLLERWNMVTSSSNARDTWAWDSRSREPTEVPTSGCSA